MLPIELRADWKQRNWYLILIPTTMFVSPLLHILKFFFRRTYRKTSYIKRTKSHNLDVSRLVL